MRFNSSFPIVVTILTFLGSPCQTGQPPEGMVYVPAGKFIMGSNEEQRKQLTDQYQVNPDIFEIQPYKEVDLPAFYIDQYEVTNREYKKFVEATGHRVGEGRARNGWPPMAVGESLGVWSLQLGPWWAGRDVNPSRTSRLSPTGPQRLRHL